MDDDEIIRGLGPLNLTLSPFPPPHIFLHYLIKLSNYSSNQLNRQSSGLNPKVLFEVCCSRGVAKLLFFVSLIVACGKLFYVWGLWAAIFAKSSTFLLPVGNEIRLLNVWSDSSIIIFISPI